MTSTMKSTMKSMMKRMPSLLLLVLLAGSACLEAQTSWKQVPIPPLPAFNPQQPKRIVLPNGLVIFLQEDHELPLIDGVARIRGGSRSEPAAKVGLVDLYGEVWRTGGTKTQTGDQLDDFLEVRAAKVETNSNSDSTTISWSCLKGDFDDVFKVFGDLLRNPEFRADKLDLAQKEAFDGISRRNDEVGDIAGRESIKLAYGAHNPYARDSEYATIAAVTRQDLVDWHHAHVYPNNIIVGIVGDFDSVAMEAKLRAAFGAWAKGPILPKEAIPFELTKPGYYFVAKTDVNQSSIRMVALGIKRDNPDYYPLQVFNELFGGGFSSRLFLGIRTDKGLAYSVGGGVGSAFDHPGILRISMATKSESTVEAINALYGEIAGLNTRPISDEEVKRAKDSILNSFVFNFDSPDKVLREKMAYEFYGYPLDFLEQFRAGIEKVTKADAQRVALKYMHKDQLAVLVVGNNTEFDKPLSSLGTVTNVDIAIPPPPGEAPQAAPAKPVSSNADGKALAAKVVAALGGEAKVNSIKSLRTDFSSTQVGGPPTPIQALLVFPDHMYVTVQTPNIQLSIVVSPEAGFMSAAGMGVRDLPAAQKKDTLDQLHHDLVYLGQHINDPAFSFVAGETAKVGEVETRTVDVHSPDSWVRWYVDPKTGRVLREDYKGIAQAGPFDGQTDLLDWQTADGLTLSYLHKNKQNGQDSSSVQFTKVEINPQFDAKIFEKPAAEATPAQ